MQKKCIADLINYISRQKQAAYFYIYVKNSFIELICADNSLFRVDISLKVLYNIVIMFSRSMFYEDMSCTI